jgi:hypothetical protein
VNAGYLLLEEQLLLLEGLDNRFVGSRPVEFVTQAAIESLVFRLKGGNMRIVHGVLLIVGAGLEINGLAR